MPKQTFFNLPDGKKQRIIEATYDEFIEKPYEKVNIRNITGRAEINIASFYQYFIDKDDLYLYLLTEIATKINEKGREVYGSFFFIQSELDLEGFCTQKEIEFEATWYKVPVDVMRKFYFGAYNRRIKELYRSEVMELKAKGVLSDSLDLDLILYMVITAMFNLQMYFRDHEITDRQEKVRITHQFYNDFLPNGILKTGAAGVNGPHLSIMADSKKNLSGGTA